MPIGMWKATAPAATVPMAKTVAQKEAAEARLSRRNRPETALTSRPPKPRPVMASDTATNER